MGKPQSDRSWETQIVLLVCAKKHPMSTSSLACSQFTMATALAALGDILLAMVASKRTKPLGYALLSVLIFVMMASMFGWLRMATVAYHHLARRMHQCPGTQEVPAYHHQHRPITLVTGYFRIQSKHSVEEYLDWIELFLLWIRTPTVVYTNNRTVLDTPKFSSILLHREEWVPGRTRLRFLDLERTGLAREFGAILRQQETMDSERGKGHNYNLYLAWLVKLEALMDAARLNFFSSQWFMWSDMGALRYTHRYCDWPSLEQLNRVPHDRILMGLLKAFDRHFDNQPSRWADATRTCDSSQWLVPGRSELIDSDHIIGTFIAFNTKKNVHKQFYKALRDTYRRLIAVPHSIVKDQTVYNAMFLLHRHLFALVPSAGGSGSEMWRYLQHWLSSANERRQDGAPLQPLLVPKA
eukprot:scpid75573/ scgid2462/ 